MNQDRPKRIKKLFRNIIDKYGELQKNLSDQSQEFGYSKDIFEKADSQYKNVPDDPLLDDVEHTLGKHFKFIEDQERDLKLSLDQAKQSSYIAFSTATTSGITISTLQGFPLSEALTPPPSWRPERKKRYIKKMSSINQELGKTYASVWETFYGTTKSPEKTALYAMRQTFDHLFRVIAPDEVVIKSNYFTPKRGDKPNQVHRVERLRYAAYTKIKNKKISELLASKTKQTLDTYDKLNKMHAEKKLNRSDVQQILTSMQSVLEEWIDAIEK